MNQAILELFRLEIDKRISKVVQAPGFIRGINPKSKIENPQAPAFIRGVNLKSKISNLKSIDPPLEILIVFPNGDSFPSQTAANNNRFAFCQIENGRNLISRIGTVIDNDIH